MLLVGLALLFAAGLAALGLRGLSGDRSSRFFHPAATLGLLCVAVPLGIAAAGALLGGVTGGRDISGAFGVAAFLLVYAVLAGFYFAVAVGRLCGGFLLWLTTGDFRLARTYDRAEAAEKRGDLPAAEALYREAIAADGADVEARRRLAELRRRQGDLAGAAEELRAALAVPGLERERAFALGLFLADLLAAGGRTDEAATHLAAMARDFPEKREQEYLAARRAALAGGAPGDEKLFRPEYLRRLPGEEPAED